MKVLLTGGAGFIGSALCRHLVGQLGWPTVVVDKLTYAGHLSSLASIADYPNFSFVRADICDREAMKQIFDTHTPQAVFHLAAESHVDRSLVFSQEFVQTNVVGTFTLLTTALDYWRKLNESAREQFRFFHVSTDEVFGSLGENGSFTEATPYNPRSPYSATKASSDHFARAWHHTYGLPVIVSNCSNNYGPYQLPEKLIPLMILNGLCGAPLPIYADGRNVRDWLHVDDHVAALLLILAKGMPGETYNIGARNEKTNLALVEEICDLLDRHAPLAQSHREQIKFVADRPGHDYRYSLDATKIESTLGWQAQTSFSAGLESTVLWYLANRKWWEPLHGAQP